MNWELGSTSVDWLGGVSMTGYRTSWSDFAGTATFSVAGGLVDPSGNASSAVATPLTFLDVPKAAAFSGTTPPAMWGTAQIASGTESCGTASSCIEIGPLDGPWPIGTLLIRMDHMVRTASHVEVGLAGPASRRGAWERRHEDRLQGVDAFMGMGVADGPGRPSPKVV
jgi:hypothetical protein